MAAFIAIKPCRFGSVDYGKGAIIPDGVVLPGRARALTRMGYIALAVQQGVQEAGQERQEPPQEPPKPQENGQEPPQGQENGEEASTEKKPVAKTGKK